ncbi:MAG: hypothetical protein NWE93_05320 [Candidatus Bathyarchaeota archaeon]|nr:hypothetical protein [Candidatus Bathyarchaeota archaeon]
MGEPEKISKKSKNKLYIVVLAIVLIVVVGVAVVYSANSGGLTPALPDMAGTYVQQTSTGDGYTIVLYENGTATFSSYTGTWNLVNATTLEGTYSVFNVPRDDYFTITSNGFTAVATGNIYIKK